MIVLVCFLTAAAAGPVTDEPGTGGPVEKGSSGDSLTTTFWTSVLKGVAHVGGDKGLDWILSATGILDNDPDSQVLNEISDELSEIESTLTDILSELDQINTLLQLTLCADQIADVDGSIAVIRSFIVDYQGYVNRAQEDPPIVPSEDFMSDWVDQILAAGNHTANTSMQVILENLDTNLRTGGVSGSGILSECLQLLDVPEPGSLDDRPYYDSVSALTTYYYSIQAQGLMLLVEALHYRAWQSSPSGKGANANTTEDVCDGATGDPGTLCGQATDRVNEVYKNLVEQFALAGAPYTTSFLSGTPKLLMLNGVGTVWPTYLYKFSEAGGGDCATFLSSADPCGTTVGAYNDEGFFMVDDSSERVVYEGYDQWRVATADEWKTLLAGWTDTSIGHQANSYLNNSFGFECCNPSVILTPTTGSHRFFDDDSSTEVEVVCFAELNGDFSDVGNKQPFCDGAGFAGYEHAYNSDGVFCADRQIASTPDWPDEPPLWGDFYEIDYQCSNSGEFFFQTTPGWVTSNSANKPQYRYPVLDANTIGCTNGRSRTNPAGVPTMCGDDFDAWLADIVRSLDSVLAGDPLCRLRKGVCELPTTVVDASYSGSWYPGAGFSGQGWSLQILSEPTGNGEFGSALLYWFTYPPVEKGAAVEQAWVFGMGDVSDDIISFPGVTITRGGVFGPGFDPDDVVRERWGDLRFTFDGCDSAIMHYNSTKSGAGSLDVERLTSLAGLECTNGKRQSPATAKVAEIDGTLSGTWYDPDRDGEGWVIEVLAGGIAVVYWFTYDADGNQVWLVGVGAVDGKTIAVNDVRIGLGAFFDDFDPDDVSLAEWGTMEFTFDSCDGGTMIYASVKGAEFGSGSLNVERLTSIPGLECSD